MKRGANYCNYSCNERLPRVTGRAGRFSANGKECKRCPNGSAPNTERTACKKCELNEKFDVVKKVCTPCSPGDEVAANKSACVPCGAGKQSTKKTPICRNCVAGKEPTSLRIGCQDCQGGSASQFGVKCVKCSGGKQPNKARTTCEPCPANHYFSAEKLVCLACAAGKAPSEDPQVQGCVCAANFYNSTRLRLRCIEDTFQGAAQCMAGFVNLRGRRGRHMACEFSFLFDLVRVAENTSRSCILSFI